MQGIGSRLGSGGFIVYDDTNCILQIAYRFSEFLFVESCFQCIACKSGTNQATSALRKLIDGSGGGMDVELVLAGARSAPRAKRCYLPVEASLLIPSIVLNFLPDFVRHYNRGCQGCREIVTPKLVRRFRRVHRKVHVREDHCRGRCCRMVRIVGRRRARRGQLGAARQQRNGDLRANWIPSPACCHSPLASSRPESMWRVRLIFSSTGRRYFRLFWE